MENLPGMYYATRTVIEATEDYINDSDLTNLEHFKLIPTFFDQIYEFSFEIMRDFLKAVEYEDELSDDDNEILKRCNEIVAEIGEKNKLLRQTFEELED